MELIDAQVHVWEHDHPGRPWDPARQAARAKMIGKAAAGHEESPVPFDLMISEMDRLGVAGAVLVTTSHYGWDPGYALAAYQAHPSRFRVVHRFDPAAVDVGDAVAAWAGTAGAAGIRLLLITDDHAAQLERGDYDTMLHAASRAGLPLAVFPPRQLNGMEVLIKRFPDLQIVIDHLGMPQPPLMQPDTPPLLALPQLLALAAYRNVMVKMTAAPTLATGDYPYRDLWPELRRVVDMFGAERVLWGTDWQRVRPVLNYDQGIHYITGPDWLSPVEKTAILGGNAKRLFGFKSRRPSVIADYFAAGRAGGLSSEGLTL